MTEIRRLDPHDPLPEDGGQFVVLKRFEEDDPAQTRIEIIRTADRGEGETRRALRPDGAAMTLKEAVASARAMAEAQGVDLVYLLDRTAGPRERDILRHHGDHSVHMEKLDDFDLEEGERGSDMRDRPR